MKEGLQKSPGCLLPLGLQYQDSGSTGRVTVRPPRTAFEHRRVRLRAHGDHHHRAEGEDERVDDVEQGVGVEAGEATRSPVSGCNRRALTQRTRSDRRYPKFRGGGTANPALTALDVVNLNR
jgi:hypothetical protein